MRQMEEAENERLREALRQAAEFEKLRAQQQKTGDEHTGQFEQMNATLADLLKVTKANGGSAPASGLGALSYVRSRL